MLQISKYLDVCRWFIFPIISERSLKLEAKSRKAIFVGYPDNVKGYKLYDPVSSKFIRSRDVVFLEGKFHEFGTNQSTKSFIDRPQDLDVCVDVPRNSTEENEHEHDEPNDQVEPVEQDVVDIDERANSQPVGASYEENFMRGVEQLGRE